MSRRLAKPTISGNKVNYFLAFDMYPSDEDFDDNDIIIPDEPITPDIPSDDESDEVVWDGGGV